MLMKDERFFKTIKNFLEIYLLKQKNYSKNTQKSYRESLSLLLCVRQVKMLAKGPQKG